MISLHTHSHWCLAYSSKFIIHTLIDGNNPNAELIEEVLGTVKRETLMVKGSEDTKDIFADCNHRYLTHIQD